MDKPHKLGRPRASGHPRRDNDTRRLSLAITRRPTDLVSQQLDSLTRRATITARLFRSDTPFVWRVAAHGVVLALSLCVLLVSQLPDRAVASGGQQSGGLVGLVGQGALALAPDPVLSTNDATAQDALADEEDQSPGFISTGPIAEADASLLPWEEPQRYVVQEGDTLSGIAAEFGREPETILYANPSIRENPHNLQVGDEITILPVDGVLHLAEEGDTLASLAEKYEARVSDIVSYPGNGIESESAELIAGAEIVVPGGSMEITIPPLIETFRGPAGGSGWASSNAAPSVGSGTFHVASYGRMTSWFSGWHPGIDIANNYGTPIYAVDSGTVNVASWYGWAGNAVVINHGNGYESLYAHMQSINVGAGQNVQRGQIIGTIGCTRGRGGRCTGPHLHLEMYYNGARINPCSVGVCP